ncbi:MAG: ABC transporter permease subunit [Rhizobiales bacterium]|nr:ABC transporter permease subunit [Hyphomicrobiales bacterium]
MFKHPVWAVFRHEWRQHIYSPLTAIFLFAFTVILAAGIFLVGDFFASDEASLRLFTIFLPWVCLVLVPALSMRSWGDEATDSTLEFAFSLPIPIGQLVIGKFLAGSAILLIGLACTLPFPLTVAYLGEPDVGALAAGYLAAGLFLMVCLAICLFASALVRDQISAFVLGLALLLTLMLIGWDVAAKFSKGALPPMAEAALVSLSPKHWFDSIATGHIEFPALVYFGVATAISLMAATWAVETRRIVKPATTTLAKCLAGFLVIGAGLPTILTITRSVPLSLDLTEQQEYTVHENLLQVLRTLPHDTEVNLFWSESEPSVPLAIKAHARRVIDRLKVMERRSQGRLAVKITDPRPDSDEELNALGQQVRRIPMTSGDYFYLGATASAQGRTGRLAYFDQRRQQLLDYDLAVLLSELGRKKTRKLGILSPLVAPSHLEKGRPGLSVLEDLKRTFDVAVIPHFSETLPADLDVLLIIDATILKKQMLYSIDQYAMKGGGLVVLMDPHLQSNQSSNAVNPEPSNELNDLSDLLQRYGLLYLGNEVVGDQKHAATVMDEAQQQSSYPFWLRLPRSQFSASHPVSADLNEVLFAESGAFKILPNSSFVSLLETSDASGGLKRSLFKKQTPSQLTSQMKPDGNARTLVAASTASLRSAYPSAPEGVNAKEHLDSSLRAPPIFVAADIDWIFDPFAVQQVQTSGAPISRPLNDNWTFISNMLEYAAGDPALIAIRSRGRLDRPFTRIAALFRQAQTQYREKETDLAGRIANVEAQIAKIPEAAGVSSPEQLPAALKAKIAEIRQGLLPLRQDLRSIRLAMREGIEALRFRVIVTNLLAGPLLVLLFVLLVRGLRYRWRVR